MPPLARTLYFENSVGRLWEEPAGYLRLEYKPTPREALQFRAILTHLAQALSRHGWGNVLIDQREMAPYTPAELAWMGEEWLPRAVLDFGYRFGAAVVAHNVFARLAMNQLILANRTLPHTYRTFEGNAEAVEWLLRQR
ncbi:MAG: STAS/SEC14 domain-containing protein [Bacteroidota bacterium]|nr:STAS/SEC14 domain-containing protein [Bacteroidota bacterium]